MKKLLLSILACGTIAATQAQPGSILAFGQLGLSFAKEAEAKPTKYLDFSITPGIGYQLNNNFTAGILLQYNNFTEMPDNSTNLKNASLRTFGGGAFGRYTQCLGGPFSFFTQLEAKYLKSSAYYDGEKLKDQGLDTTRLQANLFPAIGVNVGRGFALNFGFGGIAYTNTKAEKVDETASEIHITFGQQFNVGISKNFGGRCCKKGHHGMSDDKRRLDTNDDAEDAPKPKKKASRDDDDE